MTPDVSQGLPPSFRQPVSSSLEPQASESSAVTVDAKIARARIPSKLTADVSLEIAEEKLRSIRRDPLWTHLSSIGQGELSSRLSSLNREIQGIEAALQESKKAIEECRGALTKKEYNQLSTRYIELQSELLSLQSSVALYTAEMSSRQVTSQVLNLAKEAQLNCRTLLVRSHGHILTDTSEPSKTLATESIAQIRKTKQEIEKRLDDKGPNEPSPLEAKILTEAAALLQGTLTAVIQETETHRPLIFNREKKASFKQHKEETITQLKRLQTGGAVSTLVVQELSSIGRTVHHHHLESVEQSLTKLNAQLTALMAKVTRGEATAAEKTELDFLRTRLEKIQKRYDALPLAIGEHASSEQFQGRAVLHVAIVAQQQRVAVLNEVLTSQGTTVQAIAGVRKLIGKALGEQGLKRASTFFSACQQLRDLEDQRTKLPHPRSLAQTMVDKQIEQLVSELQAASVEIFSNTSAAGQKEAAAAGKMAAGLRLSFDEQQQALSYCTKAMTKLTLFSLDEGERKKLTTMVDLLLLRGGEVQKGSLPQPLLTSYQAPSSAEKKPSGAPKAQELIDTYRTTASKPDLTIEDLSTLTQTEQTLASLGLFDGAQSLLTPIKTAHRVVVTEEEMKLLRKPPERPSEEDKKRLGTACAKLMFLAVYAPDQNTRDQSFTQATTFLTAITNRLEYLPVLEGLRNERVAQAFLSSRLNLPSEETDDEKELNKRVDTIFESSLWAQGLVTPATVGAGAIGTRETSLRLSFRRDMALLRTYVPTLAAKKTAQQRSWNEVVQLVAAYDRVNHFALKSPKEDEEIRAFKSQLDGMASYITDDKQQLALEVAGIERGVRATVHKAARLSFSSQKKSFERLEEVLGPGLYSACWQPHMVRENEKKAMVLLINTLYQDYPTLFECSPPTAMARLLKVFVNKNSSICSTLNQELKEKLKTIPDDGLQGPI